MPCHTEKFLIVITLHLVLGVPEVALPGTTYNSAGSKNFDFGIRIWVLWPQVRRRASDPPDLSHDCFGVLVRTCSLGSTLLVQESVH